MNINVIPQETTILVVDDTPTNLQVLFELLNQEGYRVASAKDGAAALARVESFIPDLILLDIMMPEMDGLEACCQLKANPATQDIPIIFMTALSDTIDKVQGLALGAVDYITKPIQHEEVLARVQVHLQLHHVTQMLEQLMAGIAHDVHGPINFIHSNVGHMDGYVQGLIEMLRLYQREYPEPSPAIVAKAKELQLDNIVGDAATVISSMHSDTERIKQSVLSLSQFSLLNNTQP